MKYSIQIIHITGWTVMYGLVICLLCFIHTEKLRRNYNDIQSGYSTEECKTIGYEIVSTSTICYIYSIDQCSCGHGRRDITQGGIPSCPGDFIAAYATEIPTGTPYLYYYFNARRSQYYTQDQLEEYVKKYTNAYSLNPSTNMALLAIATVASIIGSVRYLIRCLIAKTAEYREANTIHTLIISVELPDVQAEIDE